MRLKSNNPPACNPAYNTGRRSLRGAPPRCKAGLRDRREEREETEVERPRFASAGRGRIEPSSFSCRGEEVVEGAELSSTSVGAGGSSTPPKVEERGRFPVIAEVELE